MSPVHINFIIGKYQIDLRQQNPRKPLLPQQQPGGGSRQANENAVGGIVPQNRVPAVPQGLEQADLRTLVFHQTHHRALRDQSGNEEKQCREHVGKRFELLRQ